MLTVDPQLLFLNFPYCFESFQKLTTSNDNYRLVKFSTLIYVNFINLININIIPMLCQSRARRGDCEFINLRAHLPASFLSTV